MAAPIVLLINATFSQSDVDLGNVGIGGFLPKDIHNEKASPKTKPLTAP